MAKRRSKPLKEKPMKVTLVGPDELGYWFLHDENGNSYPFVKRHADHPAAAALFGWTAPEGVTDEEELIDSAIDFLMDKSGEDFEAPKDIADFFRELGNEEV